MVKLSFFESTPLNQFLRTLISLFILVFSTLVYKFLTKKYFHSFEIILAAIFIACLELSNNNDSLLYGIFIGILIYTSLFLNKSISVYYMFFNIFICSLCSLITYMISESKNLY